MDKGNEAVYEAEAKVSYYVMYYGQEHWGWIWNWGQGKLLHNVL